MSFGFLQNAALIARRCWSLPADLLIKPLLLATALAFVSIVSTQAHCGTCDHKDEKKDGDCSDTEEKKAEDKK